MDIQISVVIPTYRRPNLLKRCITQLFKQNLDKSCFEIIIISDGPDDQTENLVKKMAEQGEANLNYLASASKNGPAFARNLGWLSAKGKLIAFTDDDCIPDINWLKEILTNYNQEYFIAYSGQTLVPISKKPHDFELNTAKLQDADFITANCACTKKALMQIGGFDMRFQQAWREDSDLEFKLIEHQIPIIKLKKAIVVHPVRKFPWAVSIKEQKKVIYDALLFKKFPHLYREKISKGIVTWNYYLIVLLTFLSFYSLFKNWNSVSWISFFISLALILRFSWKRIKNADKSLNHILEMFITSLFIPYVASFWKIYGALKFRVLLF